MLLRFARHKQFLAGRAGVSPVSAADTVLTPVGTPLGMRQRLGIAAALLGDPPVLVLDEPFNGMDPEGIVWMRGFLRSLAAQGRALIALLSLGIATAVRDSAVAIGVVLGLLYVFPSSLRWPRAGSGTSSNSGR